MKHRQICKVIVIFLALVVLANVVSAQSKDRDNPTQLMSNEISGLIDSESKGSVYYYTFVVNPGEVAISLSVQSDPPLSTYGGGINSVSFELYDRNAEAIASKSVASYYGGGTAQAIGRVNVTRRQAVVLGINIPEGIRNAQSGKYRLKISGSVEFGQQKSNGGISPDEPIKQRGVALHECLDVIANTKGTLIIKMKDGSKKIVDLSEAETITVVP
jgi:hypothetical protein